MEHLIIVILLLRSCRRMEAESQNLIISHEITDGKPELAGLPATYVEEPEEAQTLCLRLKDEVTGIVLELLYSIFSGKGILARSARFINEGMLQYTC